MIVRDRPVLELGKRTYLSIPQLGEYLGWTIPKVRHWLDRHPDVRRAKEGHYLIVWRRDVDSQLEIDAAKYAKQRKERGRDDAGAVADRAGARVSGVAVAAPPSDSLSQP